MQLGLVTYQWGADWDLPTLIKNCQETGFAGVELRTTHKHGVEPSLDDNQRQEVAKRFGDSGVTLVGLGTAEGDIVAWPYAENGLDIYGSALVAHQLATPVSGYETESSLAGFRELITRHAVDIVQPDVIWSGGITESRRIAALAQAYGLPVIPHVFSSLSVTGAWPAGAYGCCCG